MTDRESIGVEKTWCGELHDLVLPTGENVTPPRSEEIFLQGGTALFLKIQEQNRAGIKQIQARHGDACPCMNCEGEDD